MSVAATSTVRGDCPDLAMVAAEAGCVSVVSAGKHSSAQNTGETKLKCEAWKKTDPGDKAQAVCWPDMLASMACKVCTKAKCSVDEANARTS